MNTLEIVGIILTALLTIASVIYISAQTKAILWKRIDELEAKLISYKEQADTLESGVKLLVEQLEMIGEIPVWRPGQELPTRDDTKPIPPQYRRKRRGILFQ